jgi:hypothetical protein
VFLGPVEDGVFAQVAAGLLGEDPFVGVGFLGAFDIETQASDIVGELARFRVALTHGDALLEGR